LLDCAGVVCLVVALLAIWMLGGCGGNGNPIAPPDDGGGGGDVTAAETATAHFSVDVETGEVTVTHLQASGDAVDTAAAFTGSAVRFDSSVLYDQPGSTGLKVLDVSITNNMGFAIGETPDGTQTGVRVLFGDITPVSAASDPRLQVTVDTLASFASDPTGVAVAADGAIFVTSQHQIMKIENGAVSVHAGALSSGYQNRFGSGARFSYPIGIAVNPVDGALIVAELDGNRIRRVDRAGMATLVAGTGTAGGTNGSGNAATFNGPTGVAINSAGTIYVSESAGHRIRQIVFTGTDPTQASHYEVGTLAGSGTAGFADASAGSAQFDTPCGLACDGDGNVYVADAGNCRIRLARPTGQVITIAGTGVSANTDGPGDVAAFRRPYGLAWLPDCGRGPTLVVNDIYSYTLRQVSLKDNGTASIGNAANWIVQRMAGGVGVSAVVDGVGNVARFGAPRLMGADASGNVYVTDRGNDSLRRVVPNGGFFPVGTPSGGATTENVQLSNGDGWLPYCGGANRPFITYPAIGRGAQSAAQTWGFSVPEGVTAFEFNVIVTAMTETHTPPEAIDAVVSGNKGSDRSIVHTLAGSTTGVNGFIDGVGANARFRCIVGIDFDSAGNAFVADAENNAMRRITPDGRVSTIAGSRGTGGYINGFGNVAQLNYPCGVAVAEGDQLSSSGGWPVGTDGVHILVTDLDNDRIRIIRGPYTGWTANLPWEPWNPAFYTVGTVAGDGTSAYTNGRGDAAQFSAPDDIAMGPGGIFYVVERGGGNRVRTLRWTGGDPMSNQNWEVSLLAGATDGSSGYVDATGGSARFNDPRGIAVGPDGTVYVADTYNDCIRKITPDGAVTTLAGTNTSGYVDSMGAAARFYRPWALDVGPDGYIYVADRYNYRIRRVSPAGVVTTVAGTGSSTRTDGRGNASGYQDDLGIAVGPSGDLYVGEAECIRVIERIIDVGNAG
jgi:hypothetical protein